MVHVQSVRMICAKIHGQNSRKSGATSDGYVFAIKMTKFGNAQSLSQRSKTHSYKHCRLLQGVHFRLHSNVPFFQVTVS